MLALFLTFLTPVAAWTQDAETSPQPAVTNTSQTVNVLNHIIFMVQENRGLDHYFGALREYWRNNNFSDISFDGLPQFNPTSGVAPLYRPPRTNPGCDPAYPPPNDCIEDKNSPAVTSYHLITQCIENPSPSWNEGHVDWNLTNPLSATPNLNGYVYTGAHDARNNNPPFYDTDGIRVMGYYDGSDLNYYYYMASQFATSDRWFCTGDDANILESRLSDCSHVSGICLSDWHRQQRSETADRQIDFPGSAECRDQLEDLRQSHEYPVRLESHGAVFAGIQLHPELPVGTYHSAAIIPTTWSRSRSTSPM